MIFNDIETLNRHINKMRSLGPGELSKRHKKIVMTSGGFDPLHGGHLNCIIESAEFARSNSCIFVVVVNGDSFLINKKGYAFMSAQERAHVVDNVKGVDYTLIYEHPTDMTVCEPIKKIVPAYFMKGGDRDSAANVPEFDMCDKIGCAVLFGIGGGKTQSSSEIVSKAFGMLHKNISKSSSETMIVEKPWGFEEIWAVGKSYAGKKLWIEPGHRLSKQYHKTKEETIIVISGELLLETEEKGASQIRKLKNGEAFHIKPGYVHRFGADANSSGVMLIEVSSPELKDVVRIEDDYKRS